MSATFTIILPYYCQEEVDRYLRIADHIMELGPQRTRFDFLLAASPKTRTNRELEKRFSRIAPTVSFSCPTEIYGYPQGPTAMFWDCMDYIHTNSDPDDTGFAFWLESDMIPVKPFWLDGLVERWAAAGQLPLVMGCKIPNVYKQRIFKRPRKWIAEHVNGGACYARHFAGALPVNARHDVFDMAIYPFLQSRPGALMTNRAIRLSTLDRCRSDIVDPECLVLHGFMQDKDDFIDKCRQPVTFAEKAELDKLKNRKGPVGFALENARLLFMGRGREAMLDAMYLEMDRMDYEARKSA